MKNWLLPLIALVALVALAGWYASVPYGEPVNIVVSREQARDVRVPTTNGPSTPSASGSSQELSLALSFDEAVNRGLYRMPPLDLWRFAHNHPDPKIRKAACYLHPCATYAKAVRLHGGLPRGTFGSVERDRYFEQACAPLAADQTTDFVGEFAALSTSPLCLDTTSEDIAREIDLTKVNHQTMASSIRSAKTPLQLLSTTTLALQLEMGIGGLDFRQLKGEWDGMKAMEKLNPLVSLLATKFGCDLPGYCEPGSAALLALCRVHFNLSCVPGDSVSAIAERNLSPVQYLAWRNARVLNSASDP